MSNITEKKVKTQIQKKKRHNNNDSNRQNKQKNFSVDLKQLKETIRHKVNKNGTRNKEIKTVKIQIKQLKRSRKSTCQPTLVKKKKFYLK